MPAMKLCQFRNCKVEGDPLPVALVLDGKRPRFCSEMHAAAYLLEDLTRHYEVNVKLTAMAAYEVLKPALEKDGGL